MNRPELPEELLAFLSVVGESGELRAWFAALVQVPAEARAHELARMSAAMQHGGEDRAVVRAVQQLADARNFAAATATLKDIGVL